MKKKISIEGEYLRLIITNCSYGEFLKEINKIQIPKETDTTMTMFVISDEGRCTIRCKSPEILTLIQKQLM